MEIPELSEYAYVLGPTLPGAERPGYIYVEHGFDVPVLPISNFVCNGIRYVMEGDGLFKPSDASAEEVKILYNFWADKTANSYDQRVQWTKRAGYEVYNLIKPSATDTILDVCCGTGNVSLGLVEMGIQPDQITAVDISPKMLDKAKEKAELTGAYFIEHDAASFCPTPDSFKLIVAVLGLSNTPPNEWPTIINNLVSGLTADGCFVLGETLRPDAPGRQLTRLLEQDYNGKTYTIEHELATYKARLNYTLVTKQAITQQQL